MKTAQASAFSDEKLRESEDDGMLNGDDLQAFDGANANAYSQRLVSRYR